jgi:hypothetical protein
MLVFLEEFHALLLKKDLEIPIGGERAHQEQHQTQILGFSATVVDVDPVIYRRSK